MRWCLLERLAHRRTTSCLADLHHALRTNHQKGTVSSSVQQYPRNFLNWLLKFLIVVASPPSWSYVPGDLHEFWCPSCFGIPTFLVTRERRCSSSSSSLRWSKLIMRRSSVRCLLILSSERSCAAVHLWKCGLNFLAVLSPTNILDRISFSSPYEQVMSIASFR